MANVLLWAMTLLYVVFLSYLFEIKSVKLKKIRLGIILVGLMAGVAISFYINRESEVFEQYKKHLGKIRMNIVLIWLAMILNWGSLFAWSRILSICKLKRWGRFLFSFIFIFLVFYFGQYFSLPPDRRMYLFFLLYPFLLSIRDSMNIGMGPVILNISGVTYLFYMAIISVYLGYLFWTHRRNTAIPNPS